MIEAQGLVKKGRAGSRVLDEVSFSVPKGRTFGVLGPDGAGKGMLLRILATLERATEGTVLVGGHDLRTEGRAVREIVGFAPEDSQLHGWQTGRAYLRFWGLASGLSFQDLQERTHELVEELHIADALDTPTAECPLPVRRRFGLAQALLTDPQVVILEQPLAGLTSGQARAFRASLGGLRKAGRTVVVSSRDLAEVQDVCDAVLLLQEGRVLGDYQMGDLLDKIGRFRQARVFAECDGLSPKAAAALKGIEGVVDVKSTETAVVVYVRPGKAGPEEVRRALEGEGVKVRSVKSAELRLGDVFTALRREG